jgi:hypothetical protein
MKTWQYLVRRPGRCQAFAYLEIVRFPKLHGLGGYDVASRPS